MKDAHKNRARLQKMFETAMFDVRHLTDQERHEEFEIALHSCGWLDERENEPYYNRQLGESLTLREWFDHWKETVDDGDFRGWMCENLEMADRDRLIFALTEEDAQIMAHSMEIEPLTEEQIRRVKKGVEAGLEGWQEIMATAITEAVKET